MHLPRDRALDELQHQVRMLALQNRRLTGDLAASRRETSELRVKLQKAQQQSAQQLQRTRSNNL